MDKVQNQGVNGDSIHPILKRGHWCCWKYMPRVPENKPSKVPYNPKTGTPLDPTDASEFCSFGDAYAVYQRGGYDGIGIRIEHNLVGIDIDHCIDNGGNLSELAQDVIRIMNNSYTEISPSKTGIRILCLYSGQFRYDKDLYMMKNTNQGLEVYVGGTTSRYVTITGNTVIAGADAGMRDAELRQILDKYMRRRAPATSGQAAQYSGSASAPKILTSEDEQLIERIKQTERGVRFAALMDGDMSAYGNDHSSADLAFVNILSSFTEDGEQIDRVIRSTKLMRPKWDEQHGSMTYGEMTINKALSDKAASRGTPLKMPPIKLTPNQIRPPQKPAATQPGNPLLRIRKPTTAQPELQATPVGQSLTDDQPMTISNQPRADERQVEEIAVAAQSESLSQEELEYEAEREDALDAEANAEQADAGRLAEMCAMAQDAPPEKIQKNPLLRNRNKNSPSPATPSNYTFMDMSDLMASSISPPEYLVDGVLPVGLAILASQPKMGKSWMVLMMAICLAQGKSFMGYSVHRCEVLYMALEDSFSRLKLRSEILLMGSPAPEGLHLTTEAPTLDNESYGLKKHLEKQMEKYPNLKLIIIDTLQKVRGVAAGKETLYGYDYREVGILKKFADEYNICLLLVHHLRKQASDRPFDAISGSNGIMGAADTAWVIANNIIEKKNEEPIHYITLNITGRDVEGDNFVIKFDRDLCQWLKDDMSIDDLTEQCKEEEYDNNEVVQTIRDLIADSKDGRWSGKASEILQAGQAKKRLLGYTPQKVGLELMLVNPLLIKKDGIQYTATRYNGSGGKMHHLCKLAFNRSGDMADKEDSELQEDTKSG